MLAGCNGYIQVTLNLRQFRSPHCKYSRNFQGDTGGILSPLPAHFFSLQKASCQVKKKSMKNWLDWAMALHKWAGEMFWGSSHFIPQTGKLHIGEDLFLGGYCSRKEKVLFFLPIISLPCLKLNPGFHSIPWVIVFTKKNEWWCLGNYRTKEEVVKCSETLEIFSTLLFLDLGVCVYK